MRSAFLILIVAFAWSLCRAKAAVSVDPQTVAKKLYVLKCAKCHELYDPKKYSDTDWDLWMGKMEKKSKLKPDQAEMIRSYVNTLRASSK